MSRRLPDEGRHVVDALLDWEQHDRDDDGDPDAGQHSEGAGPDQLVRVLRTNKALGGWINSPGFGEALLSNKASVSRCGADATMKQNKDFEVVWKVSFLGSCNFPKTCSHETCFVTFAFWEPVGTTLAPQGLLCAGPYPHHGWGLHPTAGGNYSSIDFSNNHQNR